MPIKPRPLPKTSWPYSCFSRTNDSSWHEVLVNCLVLGHLLHELIPISGYLMAANCAQVANAASRCAPVGRTGVAGQSRVNCAFVAAAEQSVVQLPIARNK